MLRDGRVTGLKKLQCGTGAPPTGRLGPEAARVTRGKISIRATQSLLTARGFFSFGQLIVPCVVAQTQLAWKGFGFPDADLTPFAQEFLNKSIIRGFFGDIFH